MCSVVSSTDGGGVLITKEFQQGRSITACAIVQSDRSLCCVLCCKLNRRGRGSDIFLISAQNIDAGESRGGGGGGGGESYMVVLTFYFM